MTNSKSVLEYQYAHDAYIDTFIDVIFGLEQYTIWQYVLSTSVLYFDNYV